MEIKRVLQCLAVVSYAHYPILTPPHPDRVSDASGSLEVTPVGNYPLKHEMLDTKVGVHGIAVMM